MRHSDYSGTIVDGAWVRTSLTRRDSGKKSWLTESILAYCLFVNCVLLHWSPQGQYSCKQISLISMNGFCAQKLTLWRANSQDSLFWRMPIWLCLLHCSTADSVPLYDITVSQSQGCRLKDSKAYYTKIIETSECVAHITLIYKLAVRLMSWSVIHQYVVIYC